MNTFGGVVGDELGGGAIRVELDLVDCWNNLLSLAFIHTIAVP